MNVHVILLKALARGSENGATATEYALVIAAVALVVLGVTVVFGSTLQDLWVDQGSALSIVS